jgi:beta-lactamase regulating signal transducer with metallopeptidase domain
MNALPDWLIATAGQIAAALLVWSWQALALLACVWFRTFVWAAIFLIWAAGALVALVRLWRRLSALRQMRANARPVSPAELDCADCQPELLIAGVGLGLSAEINSPVLLGVRRLMILLPADIVDWTSAGERQAMIRHELAHVERRDHWINLLPALLNVIFFFHPLVRYACRQLGLERELACDDRVVSLGVIQESTVQFRYTVNFINRDGQLKIAAIHMSRKQ